ncbi:MAG TPA: hypothetical protein VGN07_03905 [Steroidobacteraceae bacterium]|jgi:hypothetical protein
MSTFAPASIAPPLIHGQDDSCWVDRLIVYSPAVGATLLSKFALPGMGALGLGVVFPMTFVALIVGLLTTRMQLIPRRLLLLLLMLSILGLVQVIRGGTFSFSSLALMTALACAFVPAMMRGSVDSDAAVRFLCNLSALIALLGVVQFFLQFVLGHGAAFPIDTALPDMFRVKNFNDVIPLKYGSNTFKSNGVVMIEPSIFSQLCALGLIAELCSSNRRLRLGLYAAGLVVGYSGTGLLVLAVSLPIVVLLRRRWDLLLEGALFLVIIAIFAEPLHLDIFLRRLGEFGSAGSSADARFVSWQVLFSEKLWNSPIHALFGYGIGSFITEATGYGAAQMAHTKIIFEFGVLGAILYIGFLLYCFFSSPAPLPLRFAILIAYFMNGAYSPWILGLALSVLLWPKQTSAASSPVKEPVPVSARVVSGLSATPMRGGL